LFAGGLFQTGLFRVCLIFIIGKKYQPLFMHPGRIARIFSNLRIFQQFVSDIGWRHNSGWCPSKVHEKLKRLQAYAYK